MHKTGLVLPGGGARAAYQVGVLKAVAELLPDSRRNPFPIITGTSAGSINAAMLAGHATDYQEGVNHLLGVWENLTVEKIFRTDLSTMLRTNLRWLRWMIFGRKPEHAPRALLSNTPLRKMLETHVRFPRIQQAIDSGRLNAIGITASGYTSARSVTFFQGMHGVISWSRTRRDGRMTEITLDHLMASSAIPFIFPAARIGPEYFGDGSMRQAAPLSPAIHLGADKLLVIGVRNEEPNIIGADSDTKTYPTFGQIAGYILDTLFMDSLHTDVERLRRINVLLRRIKQKNPQPSFNDLRELQVAIIAPSEDIRDIALRHVKRFPRTVRTLLRVLGARNESGNQLISYLLFDGDYCRDLIELGYQDGLSQTRVLRQFIDDESEATE